MLQYSYTAWWIKANLWNVELFGGLSVRLVSESKQYNHGSDYSHAVVECGCCVGRVEPV